MDREIKFLTIQFVFFLENSINNKPEKISLDISKKLSVFDESPFMIPLPENIPVEIPFLRLNSKNKNYELAISKRKVDFYFRISDLSRVSSFEDLKSKYNYIIVELYNYILETSKINRYGYVCDFFIEESQPVNLIVTNFIKKRFDDLKEVFVRFNNFNNKNILKIFLNDITRVQSVKLSKGNEIKEGVSIHRDINTDETIKQNFNLDDFMEFLALAEKEFDFNKIKTLLE
jgi:hypothetical protein